MYHVLYLLLAIPTILVCVLFDPNMPTWLCNFFSLFILVYSCIDVDGSIGQESYVASANLD